MISIINSPPFLLQSAVLHTGVVPLCVSHMVFWSGLEGVCFDWTIKLSLSLVNGVWTSRVAPSPKALYFLLNEINPFFITFLLEKHLC